MDNSLVRNLMGNSDVMRSLINSNLMRYLAKAQHELLVFYH